ncbi:MAG: phage holin family protein [Terriglobales bacterium]
MAVEDTRTMAGVIAELKDEAKDFARTRLEILRTEYRDKIKAWKMAVPLLAVAAVLLLTAWLVFTGALISIIAAAFYPSRLAAFFGFVIVAVAYALGGVVCYSFARREIKEQGIVPERSIKVLKDDAAWLQSEAKTQV